MTMKIFTTGLAGVLLLSCGGLHASQGGAAVSYAFSSVPNQQTAENDFRSNYKRSVERFTQAQNVTDLQGAWTDIVAELKALAEQRRRTFPSFPAVNLLNEAVAYINAQYFERKKLMETWAPLPNFVPPWQQPALQQGVQQQKK